MNIVRIFLIAIAMYSVNVTAAEAAPRLAGGYQAIAVDNPQVIAAANFAAETINQGKLATIVDAQVQVVAGTNYALTLEIADADTMINIYSATVFVPLPHTGEGMQLSSWHLQNISE